jgi:hypothetical protein
MSDEYIASNQIAGTGGSLAFVPSGGGFIGLDEEGTDCGGSRSARESRSTKSEGK